MNLARGALIRQQDDLTPDRKDSPESCVNKGRNVAGPIGDDIYATAVPTETRLR